MKPAARSDTSLRWVIVFLALAVLLAGLQVWNALSIKGLVETAITATDPSAPVADLEREKTRQELIGQQIDNDSRGALSIGLTAGLSAAIAALAAILGAVLSLRGYLDAREKERRDRQDALEKELAIREKDRLARLGTDLNETVARLVSTEWRQRVVGSAGLLPFFAQDRADFHLQAFSSLIAASRIDDDNPAVRQGVRLAIERAVRSVSSEVLRDVSWQGVFLRGVDLDRADLSGVDLRDAVLENASFAGAEMAGADLTNAKLQGARFDGAALERATLTYADLAGASMAGARLGGADLTNVKVLNLDLDKAVLRDIGPGWRSVPWDATRNWRNAEFDPEVARELDGKYGSSLPRMRVAMLMWEIPPLVAGGTWTACYHLVRNLRQRGADVTVIVPWTRAALADDPLPFGVDVPIVPMEIALAPEDADRRGWSAYGGGWSPYGGGGWSPYGGGAPFWSPYAQAGPRGLGGGPYGGSYGPYGAASLSGSMLFRLMGAFAERVRDHLADAPIDLIHAHDWVTFDAARAAAARAGVPWVAHFHSTETDRQPDMPDPLTRRIEQGAVDSATRVVAVSDHGKARIAAQYDPVGQRRIDVIPNCLSETTAAPADMGRFESRRVVFLGRLSAQKGVDRFGAVAKHLRDADLPAEFVVHGDGPERAALRPYPVRLAGPLSWKERGRAFRGASAVIVPSREEPFGMVILEAMLHRVPVIYPETSGAAEVLKAGVALDTADIAAMAAAVTDLLGDLGRWERSVTEAATEIESYARRRYEDWLIAVWSDALAGAA
ncbi:Glycosyltransferase involved in cell wall bisynthesis [Rhodovulum sp. ES.010]|uniref:glycosyltransferase n=1 Tax=Rhodovulum sp. ES.010 TaxID=1882821 RepID=UPI00092B6A7A|nr:glycosyltransferase [Rhodovulum sp. ES.010]SIO30474.1 Glycosyltransferase involved in cell wall bisynthesis [Rhodovulum sp. ES.010]